MRLGRLGNGPPISMSKKPGTALIVWRKHYIKPKQKVLVRTICQVLRELYHDAVKRNDALSITRLEECHDMAKRMQLKLNELQPEKGRGAWTVVEGRAKFEPEDA